MNDALVTQSEAARILGVDRQYVRWLILSGKLTGVTIAGRPHLLRADVENFQRKREKRKRDEYEKDAQNRGC